MKRTIMIILTIILSKTLLSQGRFKNFNEREQMLKSFVQGIEFKNGKETFVWLPEIEARRTQTVKSTKQRQKPLEISSGTLETDSSSFLRSGVIERKGPFDISSKRLSVVTTETETRTALADQTLFSETGLPVVLNLSTRQFGIVFGNLIVHLHDFEKVDLLKLKYSFRIIKSFPQHSLVVYSIEHIEEAVSVLKAVRDDPLVKKVDLEILEQIQVPR